MRNINTGAVEAYDIAGNTLVGAASLGAVGLDWSVGGLAVDPPAPAAGGMAGVDPTELAADTMGTSDAVTAQLVQAMAGFGGGSGAGDSLNAASLTAETSQQTFLTTPQHA